jgi:VanZ family protein
VEPPSSSALFLLLWLLALVCVVTGQLLPGDSAPMRWIGATHVSDKLLHFAAYTLLAFIPVFGFKVRPGILAALSLIPLGVVLEFAQRLVPGRGFEVADMVANTLGVLAGTVLALPWNRPVTAL